MHTMRHENKNMICPNCKKRISKDDKFCGYCGLVLKREGKFLEEKEPMEEKQFSFKQPIFHLVLLYILTFGLYGIYWFYKTWKQIKGHTKATFSPGWRTVSLFIPFYNIWRVYTLFNDIKSLRLEADFSESPSPGWLTFLLFLFTYLTNRLPDPWYLLGLLGVLPLLFAQGALNEYWEKEQKGRKEKTKFSTKEIAVMIVGGMLIALAFWAIFIWEEIPEYGYGIPPLTQEQISAVVLLVCPDDNVEYNEFVSYGSGIIMNPEGNILTNRHVVSNEDWSIIKSLPTCFVGITDDISQPPKMKYLADLVAYSPQTDEYFDFDMAVLAISDVCPRSECENAPLFLPSSFPYLWAGYSEYLIPGSYVAIAGYPEIGASTFTLTDGVISGRVGDFVLKTDAKIDEGNSGGAALDDQNLLIGIPSFVILGTAESIGYIIDIDSIFEWYNQKVAPSESMIVPFE